MNDENSVLECPRCDAIGQEPPYCSECGGALEKNVFFSAVAWLGGLFLLISGVILAPSALVMTGSITFTLLYALDIFVGALFLPPAIRYVRREIRPVGRWGYVVFYLVYFFTHENINQAYFPPLYY